VAEDTVNAALADLSGQESRQLIDLLQRIKKTLLSEDGADGAHHALLNPARKRASKLTLGATVRRNGRAVPRIAS
jgi:hypothetical protein